MNHKWKVDDCLSRSFILIVCSSIPEWSWSYILPANKNSKVNNLLFVGKVWIRELGTIITFRLMWNSLWSHVSDPKTVGDTPPVQIRNIYFMRFRLIRTTLENLKGLKFIFFAVSSVFRYGVNSEKTVTSGGQNGWFG